MTGWQVLCAVSKSGPNARSLDLDRVRTASVCDARVLAVLTHSCPALPGAYPPQSTRTLVAGVIGFLENSCWFQLASALVSQHCSPQDSCSWPRWSRTFDVFDWTLVARCCVGVRRAVRDHSSETASRGRSYFRRACNPVHVGRSPLDLPYRVGRVSADSRGSGSG
jgi:hypothetical protein